MKRNKVGGSFRFRLFFMERTSEMSQSHCRRWMNYDLELRSYDLFLYQKNPILLEIYYCHHNLLKLK